VPENAPKKTRNRRVEAAKKRAKLQREEAAAGARQKISTFFGLALLLGFAALAVYFVFFFDAEELRRFNDQYAVLEKERIEGQIVEPKQSPDAKSKGFSTRLDPKYQLVVMANFTRSQYVFEVPEEDYKKAQVNAVIPAEATKDWTLVNYEEVSLKEVIQDKTGVDFGD